MKKPFLSVIVVLTMFVANLALVAEENVTYNADIKPILDENGCSDCHGFSNSYEGLREEISSIPGTSGIPLVNPAKPDSSVIIWRIEGNLPSGEPIIRMPQGGTKLSEETIQLIRTWIEQGAARDILVGIKDSNSWSEIKQKFSK